MSKRIEDYALIGDRRSAALVARDGSIDWLCWPHFDSDACFAALLGDATNGCWRLAPRDGQDRTTRHQTTRCYRDGTLILETRHETATGTVCVTDLMPIGTRHRAMIRQVTGERGSVAMAFDLALRFDYGSIPPWLRAEPRVVRGVVGPDLVVLRAPVDVACEDDHIVAEFAAQPGDTLTFTLQYGIAHRPEPEPLDAAAAIAATENYWRDWIGKFRAPTDWPEAVKRSLITLQALTEADTGGIIAAPTTSLPEVAGGECNWDYRYTWLRDSTFALTAFLNAGYREEAMCWRDWLLRTAAGVPGRLRTMYRSDGGRHTVPYDVDRLPGWQNSRPVHAGNTAADQFQLDIYGEVLDSLNLCEQAGLGDRPWDIAVETELVSHLEKVWQKPDQGIWELRGPARHYTHSKVMAWVGVDRYLKLKDIAAPRRRELEALRERIHRIICRDGFDAARNSFVQTFDGPRAIDAALLMLPLVGFLPIDDRRIAGTVAAIERELVEDGLVRRWSRADGPDEGAFIACTCWLADCLGMQGRDREARSYLERVIGLANDVGLLSEEWDTQGRQMLGNFPQALTHLALINTALGLCGPVLQRGGG
ncbi:MAG TPA: glycoside hydrolase family 15 protein [Stellaceae bacterium]|nr:glycoside hydrolase family 15 protein [Stellaceae bacterium]